MLGRGGVTWVAQATGPALSTVRKGRDEVLSSQGIVLVRDRRPGASAATVSCSSRLGDGLYGMRCPKKKRWPKGIRFNWEERAAERTMTLCSATRLEANRREQCRLLSGFVGAPIFPTRPRPAFRPHGGEVSAHL